MNYAIGHDVFAYSQNDLDRLFAGMRNDGATHVRLLVLWSLVRHRWWAWEWGHQDMVISAAVSAGLTPLFLLHDRPAWTATLNALWFTWTCGPEARPSDFGEFAGAVANRYGQHSTLWEIWNESNHTMFWPSSPDPAVYTQHLQAAYTAIKSVQPEATVLTGGSMDPTSATITPSAFLAAIYAAGGQSYFDGVGYHPYTIAEPVIAPSASSAAILENTAIREVMTSNGDSGKHIWWTEVGFPTAGGAPCQVTPQQQHDYIAALIALIPAYVDPKLFVYSYRDSPEYPPDTREGSFGLWNPNWVKKL